MPHSIAENARAVLLPAFDGTTLSDATLRFLDQGGVSILLGESRQEYVARQMSEARRSSETPETFMAVTTQARARSDGLLTFVDQEMGGICRLHDLVLGFPDATDLPGATAGEIEDTAFRIAQMAAAMGVNGFLAPVVDVLIGRNDWLRGRTWSTDAALVGQLSAAYVRGVQRAGVHATVKHFPGFGAITADPAIAAEAVNPLTLAEVEAAFPAFQAPIDAGAAFVMVGPAIVTALDPEKPALRSGKIISMLKQRLGFKGIVMADDLDGKATLRGDSVAQVAVEALNAGCDFLLLADIGSQLDDVAEAICLAAETGKVSAEALALSADKLRALARG
ncbi:glycoside hydrolase family 3 N-terminal domain-containing protein [Fuscibacter oryzae]|uniref:Glycoside hydrolase n=1 Tax=Fuscibacter oryzae TaxID=2803939 RepID=A0A8J7MSD6_9RHOB|nr:glycoside hydrolase family 3 N-terminal domain-containing protein [Fuscibacter oryzae]MBL4928762.1 glycoside hydrolase [Fuscibacter oryzae]